MTLFQLFVGDIYSLLNFMSFLRWLFIGVAVLGLIYLRYTRPDMHRPFKVRTEHTYAHTVSLSLFLSLTPFLSICVLSSSFPLQVPLFIPAIFSFTCFFMVFLSLYSDPVNTGIGFAISLTGIPAYYIFIVFDRRPEWLQRALGNVPSSGHRLREAVT